MLLSSLVVRRSRQFGACWVGCKLWEELDLGEFGGRNSVYCTANSFPRWSYSQSDALTTSGLGPSIRLLNNSISSYKGEVAAAGASQGRSSGAGAQPEQPVCEQAVAFNLGGLQQLELFSLFAKHFHIQITMGLYPVFVDFDRQRSDQPQAAFLVGEDANKMGSALSSWLSRSSILCS